MNRLWEKLKRWATRWTDRQIDRQTTISDRYSEWEQGTYWWQLMGTDGKVIADLSAGPVSRTSQPSQPDQSALCLWDMIEHLYSTCSLFAQTRVCISAAFLGGHNPHRSVFVRRDKRCLIYSLQWLELLITWALVHPPPSLSLSFSHALHLLDQLHCKPWQKIHDLTMLLQCWTDVLLDAFGVLKLSVGLLVL